MILDEQILLYICAGIILFLIIWIVRMEVRMLRLLRGKNAKSLEDTILHLSKEIANLHGSREDIEKYLESAEKRLQGSVSGVGTVRFNPFKGTGSGGNQSFATAFVNEVGDGVVISSIYSRERVSVYAKPLVKYKSEFDLTDEERQAINKAKGAA